jgi:hypothetical protein
MSLGGGKDVRDIVGSLFLTICQFEELVLSPGIPVDQRLFPGYV